MKKGSNEASVGAVVLVALATLGGGYTFLTRQNRGGEIYRLQIESGVATIRPGSDVMFRGVKIGEVRKVALDPKTQNPLLTLAIQGSDSPIQLRRDYEYSIRAGSFIGENYVDIRNAEGKTNNAAPTTDASYYAPNSDNPSDVIAATAPGGLTDLTSQATLIGGDFRKTLNRFNTTLDSLNSGVLSSKTQLKLAQALEGVAKLTKQVGQGFGPQGIKVGLGDPQSQRALNEMLVNASQASRDAAVAARNINALTANAQGVTRKFDTLASNAGTLTANAGTLTRSLSGVVQENRGQLRGLLTNLNGTARNVSGLTESLAFVLDKGGFKENSQVAFRSLRRAAENVEAGTQGLRTLGDPQTQQTLRDTLGSIRDATGALRDTAVTVSKTIGDPSTQQELKTTLSSLAGTAQALQGTVQNLNEITGSLKNVVVDPQTQSNLKETVANLNGTLAATRSAAERVNVLLGGKKPRKDRATPVSTPNGTPSGTPDNGSSTGSQGDTKPDDEKKRDRAGSDFPQGVDFTLRNYSNVRGHRSGDNDARTFGDLTLNANLFSAPFRLGLAGLGEGNNLTLQTGRYLGKNAAIRYGLYRSKLGVGAELHKGRFSLEGNLYDPNDGSYNAYAGFQLTPQLEILAGREERRGVRSNSIAVRLRQ